MYLNGGVVLYFLVNVIQIFRKCLGAGSRQALPFPSWLKAQGSRLKGNSDLKIQNGSQKAQSSVLSPRYFKFILFLLITCTLYLIPATLHAAGAAQVTLAWDPNTEPGITGYKIYWGPASGNYTSSKDVGNNTSATITGLDEGKTYYFAATAYNGDGIESGFSSQITYTIPFSDSDGDGVPDNQDAFPSNPAETIDTDSDGIGNNTDNDDDNDKMPDAWENQYGFNPLIDDASDDSDGDGLSNLDEFYNGSSPVVHQDNFEPDAPALTAPVNQQVVELTPVLETNQFSDPNPGDFHSATQWKIYRESDNVCIFDITSEYSLTHLEVAQLILDANSDYTWQARYYDNHGAPSVWSESGSFSTAANPDDTNSNGIPDEQEVEGLSFEGSGSVDEIESISAETDNGAQINASAAGSPEYFPFGLINFKLRMNQPGDQAVITVYFSEPAPADGRWFKYDPIEATWTDYTAQTDFSADRKSITLYLEDGGDGDADGTVNGIIVDPSGLAVSSSSTGSSGGGGGDGSSFGLGDNIPYVNGCFISTASAGPRGKQAARVHLWNEIRGRELAIVLILLVLLKGFATIVKRGKQRWVETQRRYEKYQEQGTRFTANDIFGPKVKGAGCKVQGPRRLESGVRR
jgi:hypothetical protein